jgi:hypothetical protein
MPVMQQCPPDSPLMKAWMAYQKTDDFKNGLIWATVTRYTDADNQNFDVNEPANQISDLQREQHAKGSLWAAFMAGFNATHFVPSREIIVAEIMKLVRPDPIPMKERPSIDELEKILNSESEDAVTINPDGSVSRLPPPPTVGHVVDAILRTFGIEQPSAASGSLASGGDLRPGNTEYNGGDTPPI